MSFGVKKKGIEICIESAFKYKQPNRNGFNFVRRFMFRKENGGVFELFRTGWES